MKFATLLAAALCALCPSVSAFNSAVHSVVGSSRPFTAGVLRHSRPAAISMVEAAQIPAKVVKELRDKTGAGMMDCKQALKENDGDMEKAMEFLRLKGLAKADKKASRAASEGIIETYIHTGAKLGVMVEVNCETDFVARREEFQALAKQIAMQVAACPAVEYVTVDAMPEDMVENEKRIELQKDDLADKPADIAEKIVNGRIGKILKTKSLYDQPYIRDPSTTVEELVKGNIATLGENIKVARFVRFALGDSE